MLWQCSAENLRDREVVKEVEEGAMSGSVRGMMDGEVGRACAKYQVSIFLNQGCDEQVKGPPEEVCSLGFEPKTN